MRLNKLITFLDQTNSKLLGIRGNGGRANKQADRLETSLANLKDGLETLLKDNSKLTIGVVGQMNAGKSSFLNALMFGGRSILPTAATPMTAGLTILEYAESDDEQRFEVEYYTREDWEYINSRYKVVQGIEDDIKSDNPNLASRANVSELRRRIQESSTEEDYACYLLRCNVTAVSYEKVGKENDVRRFTNVERLTDILHDYVGVNGMYTYTVKALHIYLHDQSLIYTNSNTGIVESYRIVDTPGVNDPIVSRQIQTQKFLQEAHAVFMLTRSDTFLPEADIEFMNAHISREGVSKILLIANKLDLLFRSDSNCPDNIEDAIEYATNSLTNQLELRGGNLLRQPIALFCTAGIAECVRLKLEQNFYEPNLNPDENYVFQSLKEKFPNDFCDEETSLDSLDLLADFQTIMEDYIRNEFLSNKDSIIETKITDFVNNHRDAINKDFCEILEEIDKELSLAKDCDLSTVLSQINLLKRIQDVSISKLQTRVIEFSRGLKEVHAISLFENDRELLQYKPQLTDDYKEFKAISYTRLSTILGRTKSCSVYADVLDRASVIRDEERQIDKLRNETHIRWASLYSREENLFKTDMLDTLKAIANEDSSLDINVAIYEEVIMRCIKDSLCGKSQLILQDKCAELKRLIAEYVNNTEHTNFNCTFGEMSEEDADQNIKNQAFDKLTSFTRSMASRNDAIYSDIRSIVYKHCERINEIMTDFANNFIAKIRAELGMIRDEKVSQVQTKEEVCQEIQNRKNTFKELYNIFSQL